MCTRARTYQPEHHDQNRWFQTAGLRDFYFITNNRCTISMLSSVSFIYISVRGANTVSAYMLRI